MAGSAGGVAALELSGTGLGGGDAAEDSSLPGRGYLSTSEVFVLLAASRRARSAATRRGLRLLGGPRDGIGAAGPVAFAAASGGEDTLSLFGDGLSVDMSGVVMDSSEVLVGGISVPFGDFESDLPAAGVIGTAVLGRVSSCGIRASTLGVDFRSDNG